MRTKHLRPRGGGDDDYGNRRGSSYCLYLLNDGDEVGLVLVERNVLGGNMFQSSIVRAEKHRKQLRVFGGGWGDDERGHLKGVSRVVPRKTSVDYVYLSLKSVGKKRTPARLVVFPKRSLGDGVAEEKELGRHVTFVVYCPNFGLCGQNKENFFAN